MTGRINKLDLSWAAGIVDGEGYIIIVRAKNKYRKNTNYFTLTLGVEMQSKDAIEKLHSLFGGTINVRPKSTSRKSKRDAYVWRCGGITAVQALRCILPYLVVKHRQAILGIEFQTNKMNCMVLEHKGVIGRKPIPESENTYRENYYNQMKLLNATYMDGEI